MSRCTRCGQAFEESESDDNACCFHPGILYDYDKVNCRKAHRYGIGGAPGDFWDCCGVMVDGDGFAEGCARGKHTTDPAEIERGNVSDHLTVGGLVFDESGNLVLPKY